MLTTTDNDFFGFGTGATGADAKTTATVVRDVQELKDAIEDANDAAPGVSTLITIAGGQYVFSNEVLPITGKKITIRRETDDAVVLRNVQFHLQLESIDQILIRGLAFRGNGLKKNDANDAILMEPSKSAVAPATPGDARVRITHCAFDGYYDIAVEARNRKGFPRLLATVDHCFFFDSNPGQPSAREDYIDGFPAFVNRGAVNIGGIESESNATSHSYVTVAYNVFVDIWRRCPRIANGSFGHVFNNLLYRWGIGNTDDEKDDNTASWVGMTVGGAVNNQGRALIEANRFIPYVDKQQLDKAIQIAANAKVDLPDAFPNRFDDPDGRVDPNAVFTQPDGSSADLGSAPFTEAGIPRPPATAVGELDWDNVASQAGPRGKVPSRSEAQTRFRKMLLHVLDLAGRPAQ